MWVLLPSIKLIFCSLILSSDFDFKITLTAKAFLYLGLFLFTSKKDFVLEKIPSATIVPISINNSWKMLRYGKFPMGIGNHIKLTVHQPIKIATFTSNEELINSIETTITSSIIP